MRRIALLLLLTAAACTSGRGPGDGPIGVGSRAPDFALPTLDGGTVRLSDLRGKIVFVNFWATWCAPCKDEMPSMEKLYRRFQGREFAMLAVSIDEGGEDRVRQFVAEIPHTYPVLLDVTGQRRLAAATGQA